MLLFYDIYNMNKILAKSKEELEEDLKGHELKTGHQRI
jgi:hypothetical protein